MKDSTNVRGRTGQWLRTSVLRKLLSEVYIRSDLDVKRAVA